MPSYKITDVASVQFDCEGPRLDAYRGRLTKFAKSR